MSVVKWAGTDLPARGRPPAAAARRAGLELVWKVLTAGAFVKPLFAASSTATLLPARSHPGTRQPTVAFGPSGRFAAMTPSDGSDRGSC